MSKAILPADYAEFLTGLKERIRSAQITATRAVNRELILLYWDIGRAIVEKRKTARWATPSWNVSLPTYGPSFPIYGGFPAGICGK
ncbi:MAG: hypothetical protein H8E44_40410 [Planctomycetes bacterium]|nr:hypothetical protein [Planctomycetota bacterium]